MNIIKNTVDFQVVAKVSHIPGKSRIPVNYVTPYNTQRARGQQLSRRRLVVGPVHLLPTTISEPEVSNCLVAEPWLSCSLNVIYRATARHRDAAHHGNQDKTQWILYYLPK